MRPAGVGLWEPGGEDQQTSAVGGMNKGGWNGGDREGVHVSLGVG